jgi:NADPH2:quinone reductase
VKACSINFPDVLMIQDLYQFKPQRPYSPGGEVAGVVDALGEGVTNCKLGDRVIAMLGNGGWRKKCWPMPRGSGRCPMMPALKPARHC